MIEGEGEMCACHTGQAAPTDNGLDLCVCGVACKLFTRPVGMTACWGTTALQVSQSTIQ